MTEHKANIEIEGQTIEVERKDKVLFPVSGITKGEMIDYYQKISDTFLPHAKDRPITMHRFPDGIKNEGFYQKDRPDYFPDWMLSVELKKKNGTVDHILCNDKATLIYLANQACITFHTWLSKTQNEDTPDKIIFDLDPPSEDAFDLVKKGAKAIQKYLQEEFSMESFLMTSGSKGLHVVLSIKAEYNFDTVSELTRKMADEIASRQPNYFTTHVKKSKREGRLFIDYLRMSRAQTCVSPYSLRAIEGAPVATPLEWDELKDPSLTAQTYTISNIFRRLGQMEDPWKHFLNKKYSISEPLSRFDIK